MKVRELLELLYDVAGRDALNVLLDARSLSRGKEIDEKLERLSRSYRGEIPPVINDMRQRDLGLLLEHGFEIQGREHRLPAARLRRLEELRHLACQALVDDVVPLGFKATKRDEPADSDDSDDLETEASSADESATDETDSEGDNPFDDVGDDWTRPRDIARVMYRAGFDVPERLRTPRFQELLSELRRYGVEMREQDNDHVFDESDETPGIATRVRLRRIGEDSSVRRDEREMESTPPRAVGFVASTHSARASRPAIPSPPTYEVALSKLQFLTGLPTMERERRSDWPAAFVDAACSGIELTTHEREILLVVAQNYRRGTHLATGPGVQLAATLPDDAWELLLKDFARLNDENSDAVGLVVKQVVQFRAGPRPRPVGERGVERSAPRDDDRSAPSGPRVQPLHDELRVRAAGVQRAAEPRPADESNSVDAANGDSTNVRNLGALEDMFD